MLTHGASLFAAILAAVLELTPAVYAQARSTTVQGTAIDESAAIVPGVRVTVVNLATGETRTRPSTTVQQKLVQAGRVMRAARSARRALPPS